MGGESNILFHFFSVPFSFTSSLSPWSDEIWLELCSKIALEVSTLNKEYSDDSEPWCLFPVSELIVRFMADCS